jgi:hypothetical protein
MKTIERIGKGEEIQEKENPEKKKPHVSSNFESGHSWTKRREAVPVVHGKIGPGGCWSGAIQGE